MKIALICTEKLPVPPIAGGAIQLYIDGILPYLSGQHDITVYCVQHPKLPELETRDNVRYIRIKGATDTTYVNNLKSILKPEFDLIHVFNRPRFLAALSEGLPDSKFSLSLHNEMFHVGKISDEAALKCIERSEFINTVSQYIANTVTQRFPAAEAKMRVVYSGVDTLSYHPGWTEEGARFRQAMKQRYGLQDYKVVLYVGRLSVKKGVHVLLRAMDSVMKSHNNTALVIAGSKWYGKNDVDDYTRSIREQAKSLPGPVIFTGFIPPADIPDYYSVGDVFVCASQWSEPLARVHYEAMAAGLPIITTNRGGNAEVVSGYGNGIVIDEYDNPDVMAQHIRNLLDNPKMSLDMGVAGRKLAEERFRWERVAAEIFPGSSPEETAYKPVTAAPAEAPSRPQAETPPMADLDRSSETPSKAPETPPKESRLQDSEEKPGPLSDISIIGTGYVGLVTGACLASMGMNVYCCDQDAEKINSLKEGVIPIFEPSLDSIIEECARKQKKLHFTTDIKKAVSRSDVIFITVNTPTSQDNTCDVSHVFEAAREIAQHMNSYKVIVNKSTVPVGTGMKVKNEINKILKRRKKKMNFDVVSNPEFLKEGSSVSDFTNPDRIIIGAENDRAADIMKEIYRSQIASNIPVLVTSIETAEMIKYASNSFLAMKISFINEVANICELCNIDIRTVTRGMGLDKRIGMQYLNPGPGFGGSCFPKDVRALTGLSREYGYEPLLLDSVLEVNNRQKKRMIEKIEAALDGLEGRKIAVLGLAFKPGTDDIRESPSLTILASLLDKKAAVSVYDPQAMDNMKKNYPQMDLEYFDNVYSACSQCDCIVLATEWEEFANLDFSALKDIIRKPVFIDLRNVYDPEHVRSFGFYYEGVGRK